MRRLAIIGIGLAWASSSLAQTGNVIFLHPDGTGVQAWTALRFLQVGPDGFLNWDRMPYMANYRGHMSNALAASSNGGGSVHAYGVPASTAAFGQEGTVGMISASGKPYSIMVEAKKAGMAIGIVSSATVADAGTGTFLARTTSRRNYTEIVRQMLSHQPEVLLGGGEAYFLPQGTKGLFGEGMRTDGRNLIQEAKRMGYTVVYTAAELKTAARTSKRILGLFAREDTFNDENEETLREEKKPMFVPTAARFDEMTDAAIKILERSGRRFLLVAEEEGTDNFAGDQNASGVLESLRGADRAIGIAQAFQKRKPNTLILVASDSNCGGMAVIGETAADTPIDKPLPAQDEETKSAIDGRFGTGSIPFLSAPNAQGRRFPFGIGWAGGGDMAAGVVAKAQGLNANRMGTNLSNRGVYRLMYRTLFGRWPEPKR